VSTDAIAVTCPLGHGFVAPREVLTRISSRYMRCPGTLPSTQGPACVVEIEVAALLRRMERGESDWVIQAGEISGLQERMAI
jgi:hypothetical protein